LFALSIHPELRSIFGEAVDIEINHGLVWPSGDNAAETTDSDSDILPEEEPVMTAKKKASGRTQTMLGHSTDAKYG
jgi:hypothetical protein